MLWYVTDQHILKFQHFTSVMFIWVLVEQANHYSRNIFSKIDIQWTGHLRMLWFKGLILSSSAHLQNATLRGLVPLILGVGSLWQSYVHYFFCKVLFFFLLFSSFFLSFFLVFLLSFLLLFFFHFFLSFSLVGRGIWDTCVFAEQLKFHFWLKVQGTDVYLACWRRK